MIFGAQKLNQSGQSQINIYTSEKNLKAATAPHLNDYRRSGWREATKTRRRGCSTVLGSGVMVACDLCQQVGAR